MKRIVIYTALIGDNYDDIIQPKSICDFADYICFVKKGAKKESYIGVWKIEEIDYNIDDNGRLSRYPKLLPHKTIISNYKYSLYIDANITIKDVYVYNRILALISEGKPLALVNHPYRDCPYQELYVCIAGCKGSWKDLFRQYIYLKYCRIPRHSGLYEANVIFREHNNPDIIKMGELWWHTFMKYSRRDQLSLITTLKITGIHVDYFLEKQYSARNHPAFDITSHKPQKYNFQQKIEFRIVSALRIIGRLVLKDYKKQ